MGGLFVNATAMPNTVMPDCIAWLEQHTDHCLLQLRIHPGAKHTSVIGTLGARLKIAVQAPPVDGKANDALLRWLAKTLEVKGSAVTLVSGQASRDKRIRVEGVAAARIRAALDSDGLR